MSDDTAKAIAAAQQPLLERLDSIEKSMRTIAAAQAAAVLYAPQTLSEKVAEHTRAVAFWRKARDEHNNALATAPADTVSEDADAKNVARKMLLQRVQAAAKAVNVLTEDEPVIAVLVRASGGGFP